MLKKYYLIYLLERKSFPPPSGPNTLYIIYDTDTHVPLKSLTYWWGTAVISMFRKHPK